MHIAEAGEGPLVLLLHGFPELWYSWRHQLLALAAAGFHVVAPDQRGYGQSERPEAVESYSMFHLVGDVIGLLDALAGEGETKGVVVGHDWGAPVAWHTALFRPDRVRGVVGLSVPFRPRGTAPPTSAYRAALGEGFYQLYFQPVGPADADLERDVRATMVRLLYGLSGDNPSIPSLTVDPERGFLGDIDLPARLPGWLSEEDISLYVSGFQRSGFTGGLNWYRNIDLNWTHTAPWHGAGIDVPALYVVGDRDPVYRFPGMPGLLERLPALLPRLRGVHRLDGCGHWTQQERAGEVNKLLLDFLHGLPA